MGSGQTFLQKCVVLDLPVPSEDSAGEGERGQQGMRPVRKEGWVPLCKAPLGAVGL